MLPKSLVVQSLVMFVGMAGTANAAFAQATAATPVAGQYPSSAAPATPPSAIPATAPGATAPGATAPGATAPAAVAPAAVAPAPATAPVLVPPGYALVPINAATEGGYYGENPAVQATQPEMELPYEEGEPVPPGYRVVKQTRRGLVIAGSIVGGIAYGFSITGAVGADFDDKSGALLVPVLGPWLMLAMGGASDDCSDREYMGHCDDNAGLRSMLVLDGLTQVAGATMLVVGLAVPTTRLVRRNITLSMAPMSLGKGSYGIGAIGRF